MVSLCRSVVLNTLRRNILVPSRWKTTMGDPMEHATGLEKRELLAQVAGINDPYKQNMIKRGPSTKDEPTPIPSAYDARLVGCICNEEAMSINYMWLYKGQPKRCECGCWFCLVPQVPL